MNQLNFNNQRNKLSESDVDAIVEVIAGRCMNQTKRRLKAIIAFNVKGIPSYGIFDRLIKDERGWYYCAGQDAISELKTIRNLILRGR